MKDYTRTVLFYCREFISEAEMTRGLALDHEGALTLIDEMLQDDLFNEVDFQAVIHYLNNAVSYLLTLYSRNPQDSRIDSLYRRAGSIREMGVNLLRSVEDENSGGPENSAGL